MPLPQTAPQTPPRPRRQAPLLSRVIPAIGAVAMVALLAGCTGDVPLLRAGGPGDQHCRDECNVLKTQCQQRQQNRELGCAAGLKVAAADGGQCRKPGVRNCGEPYTCLGADMSICQREYLPCAKACGGSGEPRPNAATGSAPPAKADKTGGAAG
ncbi:hypothetical protein [uncultured Thiodictyon sp.]|uniref:hypothetical protein n=1 Tax=uncultured Thiodictyon sp. TaxID=1846217 RepID=UPI0025E5F2E8|nr:hypothetical protein [uncultured Thiodictyon sp.]